MKPINDYRWLAGVVASFACLLALAGTPASAAGEAASPAGAAASGPDPGAELASPRSGWRSTGAAQGDFLQAVHYPRSEVNVRSTGPGLIAGRIRGDLARSTAKPAAARPGPAGAGTGADGSGPARQPGRLVVDGIALPLLIEVDGSFARPWAFGPGSHGVEVRSPDGATVLRRQFYEANPLRPRARLRVVLSWDSDQTDLDLHVLGPDGSHVFYANRVAANGGALDVDVTTGFGPEIFATPAPLRGAYHVYVNYYGAFEMRDEITVAQVAVITEEGTPQERQQWRRVPLRRPGELTHVFSFLMP